MSRHPVRKLFSVDGNTSQLDYEHAVYLSWLGRAISHYRRENGYTQRDFAAAIRLQPCQVAQLENGSVDFKISTLFKIAVYLNFDPKNLIPDLEELEREAMLMGGAQVSRSGPGRL